MCGRYAQGRDPATLAEEFDALDATDGAWSGPDHNVAPTATVLAVVDRHPRDPDGRPDPGRTERTLRALRWGLVPAWVQDPAAVGPRLINARAETLTEKPAFRRAAASRRCLVPADGWYEWRRDGERRTPFFVTPRSGEPLAFAGLWESWHGGDGDPLVTTTIVTTDAIGTLTEVHHRMPMVLPRDRWAAWLDPDRAADPELLAPPTPELVAGLEVRQVSSRVNSVRHHGPELTDECVEEPEQIGLDLDVPDR